MPSHSSPAPPAPSCHARPQTARKIHVAKFRAGRSHLLVTTDVAARGIDIPLIDNVINFDFPPKPELFVHRVGRAARAGRSGTAYRCVQGMRVLRRGRVARIQSFGAVCGGHGYRLRSARIDAIDTNQLTLALRSLACPLAACSPARSCHTCWTCTSTCPGGWVDGSVGLVTGWGHGLRYVSHCRKSRGHVGRCHPPAAPA